MVGDWLQGTLHYTSIDRRKTKINHLRTDRKCSLPWPCQTVSKICFVFLLTIQVAGGLIQNEYVLLLHNLIALSVVYFGHHLYLSALSRCTREQEE